MIVVDLNARKFEEVIESKLETERTFRGEVVPGTSSFKTNTQGTIQ
jgi:hypothetical protein